MRRHVFPGLPPFNDVDSCSDFTYCDYTGTMATLLNISVDSPKTFHIEVKTSKAAENGFSFSSRQFKTVKNRDTEKS